MWEFEKRKVHRTMQLMQPQAAREVREEGDREREYFQLRTPILCRGWTLIGDDVMQGEHSSISGWNTNL